MGDLKQKTLKGRYLGPSLPFASVRFPHPQDAVHSQKQPQHTLCLKKPRTWNFPRQKHFFSLQFSPTKVEKVTYDQGRQWMFHFSLCSLMLEQLGGVPHPASHLPFCALWWDVVEHDRHLVLCLGEKQRGEKWGILNTMQRFTAVTIVSIILDMTLMQAQCCL